MSDSAELDTGEVIIVKPRRARLTAGLFQIAVALMMAASGGLSLVSRKVSAVSTLSELIEPPYLFAVNVGYVASGLLVLAGLWWGHRRWEAAGLLAQAFFLGISLVVVIEVRGLSAIHAILTFGCLIAASLGRVVVLGRRHHIFDIVATAPNGDRQ